jgi:hypothetical protein
VALIVKDAMARQAGQDANAQRAEMDEVRRKYEATLADLRAKAVCCHNEYILSF